MNTELRPGDTVHVTDYYGMMGFQGTYLGIYRDEANAPVSNIMVVSFKPGYNGAPPIRYAGCVAEPYINKGYGDKPDSFGAYLTAHYYGDSIETLAHCSREQKPRQWEKK